MALERRTEAVDGGQRCARRSCATEYENASSSWLAASMRCCCALLQSGIELQHLVTER